VRYDVDFWLASDASCRTSCRSPSTASRSSRSTTSWCSRYAARHASFVATSGSSVLQFGFRNDSGLLHLDDVRVAAIPEPAINLLMAAGLGALALLSRRRGLKGRRMKFDLVKRIGALLDRHPAHRLRRRRSSAPLVDTASTERRPRPPASPRR
jgi:hypothetical protein